MEHYRGMYQDDAAQVHAVASHLEGSALGWLVSLHDEPLELDDLDTFMQGLWEQFEEPMAAHQVKACIHTLKQGKYPVTKYIQDFCSLASYLRDWSECMLVSYFQEGLNKELYQNCLPRGVLRNLQAWFQVAIKVEIELIEFRKHTAQEDQPRQVPERCMVSRGGKGGAALAREGRSHQSPIAYFCCGKEVHQVVDCLTPHPASTPLTLGQPRKKPPVKPKEKTCVRQ